MKVILNNIRIGEDYREAETLKKVVSMLNNYIKTLMIRSSEMDLGFGDVYVDGELKYNISYNGEVILNY